MADISSITLPNGNTYNFKDSVARSGILQTKTFTNVVASANNQAGGVLYFGTIMPTTFYAQWSITFRITADSAGSNVSHGIYECIFSGTQSALTTYHNWNSIANTSYRPIYCIDLYRATEAGITGGYGHALGVRLQSAWNPTTAANSRTITIDILETVNCTFTFYDSIDKYADIPGTGTTNYSALSETDAYSNGLRETGDDNTYAYNVTAYYSNFTVGTNGVFPYTILMEKPDGKWESIVKSYTTGTKEVNTNGFLLESFFYYHGGTKANGEIVPTGYTYITYYSADVRYIINGATTSASTSVVGVGPLYLVGTITNGLFYLDTTQWWSQSLPSSDDGKVYIYIGFLYGPYAYTFNRSNEAYWYKNGAIRQVTNDAVTVSGHSVATDVPANAVFTDTTYPLSIVHSTDSAGDVFDITFTTT